MSPASNGTVLNLAPILQVGGADLTMEQMSRFAGLNIERSLRLPGRAVFRFNDSAYKLTTLGTFSIGKDVKIKVKDGGVLFHGLITGVSLLQDQDRLMLSVIADEYSIKLTVAGKIEAYLSQSFSDIVTKVAQRNGLTTDADSTTELHDYVLQADSDFDFVNQLADRVGYDWWMDGKKLCFKKPVAGTPAATLELTKDLLEFTVNATGLHPNSSVVAGWDPGAKQVLEGTATVSAAALKPDAAMVTGFLNQTEFTTPARSAIDGPVNSGEAGVLAGRLSQRWASSAVTARGTALNNAAVVPGKSIKVSSAGPASGTYHVTEVIHSYTTDGFYTRFVAGDRRPTTLVDSLATKSSSSFVHSGLVIGVVTQNEVKTPGKVLGRPGDVKVKYVAADATVESHWARVATIGGGKSRGITFMPEIDDEVIIGFEGGDTRRPIVLGGVYNGKDRATEYGVKNGKVNSRRIMSRKGTFVELVDGDSADKDTILLSLNGAAHTITLDGTKFEAKIPANKEFSIVAGDKGITMGTDGTLTLTAQKIVLKATTDVEISGVNVKAKATAAFEAGGATTAVKASGMGEVSAGGPMTVKGAIVQIN